MIVKLLFLDGVYTLYWFESSCRKVNSIIFIQWNQQSVPFSQQTQSFIFHLYLERPNRILAGTGHTNFQYIGLFYTKELFEIIDKTKKRITMEIVRD